jgi:iron complex transport system ATP-binding protein
MRPPLLELKDLEAGYAEVAALTEVSLRIGKGEFVALVGPNGSGKSTLIRALSRGLPPRQGAVLLDGADLYHLAPRAVARRIGVVPQNGSPGFPFSVLEVVLMGRSPHLGRLSLEGRRDYDIAERCLRVTDTWHLRDRSVNAVSGGEKQRVMIARALAQEPEILLLDEPTAFLDIAHQISILDLVKELNGTQGLTVLAALHDLNLASQYAQRLLMLDHGRVVADGSPGEVITPERILQVYRTQVAVRVNPLSGRPYVTLMGGAETRPAPTRSSSIHVIAGAGMGSELMERLVHLGYRVSAGVLNVEDSDQQTAERLGIDRAEEAPFSPITDEPHERNRELIRAADFVVVAPIPFGQGNLRNLEAAVEAGAAGKRVVLLDDPGIQDRDFADGAATALYEQLRLQGATVVSNTVEALGYLETEAP